MTETIDGDPINGVTVAARPWRPPPLVKLIAAWEVAAGVVLAVVILRQLAHGTAMPWQYELLVESIVVAALVGGVALWRGNAPGFLMSCVLQLLQIVQVYSGTFAFGLVLGPDLAAVFGANGTLVGRADLRAALTLYVGGAAPDVPPGVTINVVALVVLLVLIRSQRQSAQPWLRRPGTHAPWDRARLIGAYQIGAGMLGVFNAMSASTYAAASLIFSTVVIASGIALVRRARWSDTIGVAVNMLQVPVFGVGGLVCLVRSGLSSIVAVTSRGLRLQFDVGSVLGDALAPQIDWFVGINLTALALAIILVAYDANDGVTARIARQPRAAE
jgi:hypothetical protein